MTNDAAAERRLGPDELYNRCDPDGLGFGTTAEVAPIDGTVGQDRAIDSMQFGLEIEADGYNLFVTGPPGVGRNSTLRAIVERIAATKPKPPSWCYVYDFKDSRQPSVMSLPVGRAHQMAHDMDDFVEAARREVPSHFESDTYTQRREELAKDLQDRRAQIFDPVEEEARSKGFAINTGAMGVATVPLKEDGQPMSREEFMALPEETRKDYQSRGEELQSRISQGMNQARRLEKDAQAAIEQLDKTVALSAISPLLNDLRQEYVDIPKAIEYLDQVEDDVVQNLRMFLPAPEQQQGLAQFVRPSADDFFTRYHVNVIVSREEDAPGAPVVIENNPTYYNLFGRVDYRSQLGAVTTDHTMIKAGAVHRANGGYLILQALDALTTPLVWETLKRTIRAKETRIENLGEQYSAIPVATLNPQPIPLDVKVVLVGSPNVYYTLYRADEDFRKLFRAKADFAIDMTRTPDCVQLYAGFIASRVREEGLRPFDKGAVARVVEHGSRAVEHQRKLSTRFIDIGDLLTEADFWAGREASDVVHAEHVERAIEEKIYRSNLIEERVQSLIDDGTILIDTTGAVPGQINGISVYSMGDYAFGRPTRITASVSPGRGQVVSIDRETNLSGRLHNKGFAILSGYLNAKFAQQQPLALAATIGFEQTYDEIEGDSASAAELYVLLSALAELPINQGIAVTGSVNQKGESQAIGGVNPKVEGFYAVCKAQGLTGEQGVMIPKANAQHLMLRREIRDAVRDGSFRVWAVENVDEGLEILTGTPAGEADARGRYPAGTINRRITDKLSQMSRRLEAAARRRGPRRKANDGDGESPREQTPA